MCAWDEGSEGSSLYFQMRIVRSREDETRRVGERNLAAFISLVWPPELEEGEVAMIWFDMFHTRSRLS